MVNVRINDVYKSFVKGNCLMLSSSLGIFSLLSYLLLLAMGIVAFELVGKTWVLIVSGIIALGYIVLCVIHLSFLPMLAKNDEYFGSIATMEISVNEDIGLYVEGFDSDNNKIKAYYVCWGDINKITYHKKYFAIQAFGNEMFFIEHKEVKYVEGNPKTLEYYLRSNVDRRAIKIKKWKKVVK